MRILFYFGHPSQYLFLRDTISSLKEAGHVCEILIKSKDVLEDLLIANNEEYTNILPEGRKSGKFGILAGLIKRDLRLFKYTSKRHYDLFIGTDPSLAHIGYLKKIPVITVIEDDIEVIPRLARLTYPFTSVILTPLGCKTGKYEYKTCHYNGYMKLSYLHPSRFIKDQSRIDQPYFLIRTSGLDAHHDNDISGLSETIITEIINGSRVRGKVYISSEKQLPESLTPYLLKNKPSDMQQILANAGMLISDSQSMTMEAAMLGVPSIRFSSFAGRISVLEELEKSYGLTYGIAPDDPDNLFRKIDELQLLAKEGTVFQDRRQKMLNDKIDVTAFMIWFIKNYPESVKIMKENPEYQNRFK